MSTPMYEFAVQVDGAKPRTVKAAYYQRDETFIEFKDAKGGIVYTIPIARLVSVERGEKTAELDVRDGTMTIEEYRATTGIGVTLTSPTTSTFTTFNAGVNAGATAGEEPPDVGVPARQR